LRHKMLFTPTDSSNESTSLFPWKIRTFML
jgi:hypothetical protein